MSDYKLRKTIRQLERKNRDLEDKNHALYEAVISIFDSLCSCKPTEYITPIILLNKMRPLVRTLRP